MTQIQTNQIIIPDLRVVRMHIRIFFCLVSIPTDLTNHRSEERRENEKQNETVKSPIVLLVITRYFLRDRCHIFPVD